MAAAAAYNPVTGPVDSLEVRWIVPGLLRTAVREWFARFPAETERREDIYLLQPRLRGLSVKLRDRDALDIKACLGSPGVPGLPVRGRLESWRKWSFSCDPPDSADAAPAGWITVRKHRLSSWFPLTASRDLRSASQEAGRPGCAVELTEFHVRSETWWTLGFEATGPAGLRPDALRQAASLVFAQPLPAGVELGLDNSWSYAQWLHDRLGPGAGDATHPTLRPAPSRGAVIRRGGTARGTAVRAEVSGLETMTVPPKRCTAVAPVAASSPPAEQDSATIGKPFTSSAGLGVHDENVPRPRPGGPHGGASRLRWFVMPANRMNRDEFYAAMAPNDDARLRKILWTLYWRGNAQVRERIEEELRPPDQPKVKPKKELPDPVAVLDEVTTFAGLARDGAYMAGDRRVHHTERSRWRLTFRRLTGDALAALHAEDPGPAQQAVAEMVDLACDMKSYDCFHSDDPVEAAKFVVSDAVAVLWESVLRHDGFAAFTGRVPDQLVRWESAYGWTRRGYGQVPEKETALAVPLARLLTTPDMWRTFAESYLDALDTAGRADPGRPRTVYGSFDETSYRRGERARDLAAWHEMLLDRFAGTPEDELLDRLAASPALAGPELTFLRARIAERRGDVARAAALVTECLKDRPGDQEYLDFAVDVGAVLPPRAREIQAERAATQELIAQAYRAGRVPSG